MKSFIYPILSTFLILFSIICCRDNSESKKQISLSGNLVSHSDCKSSQSNTFMMTPDSLSCAEYSWDVLTNKLAIKHKNAGFNCCPDTIYCQIALNQDTIVIQEIESNAACECECLFDLDIEIEEVGARKFQIKFIEPLCGDQEQLIFEIDLATQTEGSYCVRRDHYPWGGGGNPNAKP